MLYPAPHLEIPSRTIEFAVRPPTKKKLAQVTFLLGYHGDAEDFPLHLRDDFEAADIILHEHIGWTPEEIDALDRTAAGEDVPVFRDVFGINERKKKLLIGTAVRNGSWDIPYGHTSYSELFAYFAGTHMLHADEGKQRYVDMVLRRDRLALRTIGTRIDTIGDSDQIDPKVLVIAGLSHVALANMYRLRDPSANIKTAVPDIDVDIGTSAVIERLS